MDIIDFRELPHTVPLDERIIEAAADLVLALHDDDFEPEFGTPAYLAFHSLDVLVAEREGWTDRPAGTWRHLLERTEG